jgi:YidC/Oxa1 family membrane protein insertase
MFTGLAVFFGIVTAFQPAALQLYFFTSGILGGATGWLLRQNGFRSLVGIRKLPSKESTEMYTKVTRGELKLNQIKGPDGKVRYQPPTRRAVPTNRRQLSGINVKPGVALPAHLKTQAPKAIDIERPDRDVDFEEGTKGKPISEKLDFYRRNYRLSYVWRRMGNAAESWGRSLGFGEKKVTTEEARRLKKAEDYEIERRRRFQNRA